MTLSDISISLRRCGEASLCASECRYWGEQMKTDAWPKSFPAVAASSVGEKCLRPQDTFSRRELDGGGIVWTYFLHDVIDPGRCAVAEVRALGIPVAQVGHAHVCGHACKTSKANRVRQEGDGHSLTVWSRARGKTRRARRESSVVVCANLLKCTRRCETALVALHSVRLKPDHTIKATN